MKLIIAVIVTGSLILSSSTQAYAFAACHVAEAMGHAGKAQVYGELEHAKEALQYAKESLVHAKEARNEYGKDNKHMDQTIKYLEEAIKHASMNNPKIAAKYAENALRHMRDSCR
ncbi:MAG TPA: metal-binding protein SmbP [Nitrosomonas nitrosa]|nr:metal-binding protein SmbP [Nitrosomonas nitrosa]HNP51731.1 small metal-binding protein SmbP [Nitrosomonas nitrosa]